MIRLSEPTYLGNELEYVTQAVVARDLSQHEWVTRLEALFAETVGTRFAVACNTGTAALHLALLALGVGPGDEVIVPACTYIATANAVRYCGAVPVFVDVRPDTWTIDWAQAAAAVTPRTRGVIPVHLYGVPAGAAAARAALPRELFVLEDAAEAHGAREASDPRQVGSYGQAGCFSFYGNKIVTCGEGGMVTTDSISLTAKMRLLRGVGQSPVQRYVHTELGFNYRMTDLCAALALAQAEKLDEHLARRRALGDRYRERVPEHARQAQPTGSVDWVFPVRTMDRDGVAQRLAEQGVETRPVFPPLHRQPIYAGRQARPLPVAEMLGQEGLLLPLHAGLSVDDVDAVCDALIAARAEEVRA